MIVTKCETKEIKRCYHECLYFGTSMDGMECLHPYFNDKGAYSNMIISHPDCDNGFPKDCPLMKGV
jgi:hypothetical protein